MDNKSLFIVRTISITISLLMLVALIYGNINAVPGLVNLTIAYVWILVLLQYTLTTLLLVLGSTYSTWMNPTTPESRQYEDLLKSTVRNKPAGALKVLQIAKMITFAISFFYFGMFVTGFAYLCAQVITHITFLYSENKLHILASHE